MPAHWIVDVAVETAVRLPGGEALERDTFYAWLWEAAPGLVAIDEGAVTVAEAVAHGLTDAPLLIDVAAAPAARDWVGRLDVAEAACWFADERAARDAMALIAEVAGCRVQGMREEGAHDDPADWRSSFSPIEVTGFGVVRPAWDEGPAASTDAGVTIFIEPGAGFGTGLHETTQLCLTALREWRHGGGCTHRVLDFGSGSGILGIAAAVCGAGQVDAVEIDPLVHQAIRANAQRNGVAERVHVFSAVRMRGECYDLVLANIVAPVLLGHAEALCARVVTGGGVVLSGLRAEEVATVAERYATLLGCRPEVTARGDWRCLTFAAGERAAGTAAIQ